MRYIYKKAIYLAMIFVFCNVFIGLDNTNAFSMSEYVALTQMQGKRTPEDIQVGNLLEQAEMLGYGSACIDLIKNQRIYGMHYPRRFQNYFTKKMNDIYQNKKYGNAYEVQFELNISKGRNAIESIGPEECVPVLRKIEQITKKAGAPEAEVTEVLMKLKTGEYRLPRYWIPEKYK